MNIDKIKESRTFGMIPLNLRYKGNGINATLNRKNQNDIINLEISAKYLKKLNFIMNVALFNGAYSDKNLEQRICIMKKINVPQWEQDILTRATDTNRLLSKDIFIKLDKLLNEINLYMTNTNIDDIPKSIGDMQKEIRQNAIGR